METGRTGARVVKVRSPQTLSVEDRRVVAVWAADCAEHVLGLFESAVPGDARVRDAIGMARSFAAGDLPVVEAIRRRGGDAGAAARIAPTPAARAAAYAAEQVAAVAHVAAHALGAAGYAAKAASLAVGADDADGALAAEVRCQLAGMDAAVASALAKLPLDGSDGAGPLGPGRLSGGPVGVAIRLLQAGLVPHADRSTDGNGPERSER